MDGQSAATSEAGVRQAAQVSLQVLHEKLLPSIRTDQSHEYEA